MVILFIYLILAQLSFDSQIPSAVNCSDVFKCLYPSEWNESEIETNALEKAISFMNETDEEFRIMRHFLCTATFKYESNLTDANKMAMDEVTEKFEKFYELAFEKAQSLNWKEFKGKNDTLYRWFMLFFKNHLGEEIKEKIAYESKFISNASKKKSMTEIFNEAKLCPYKHEIESECTLNLDSYGIHIMHSSRNPEELEFVWSQWRDVTGKQMRQTFLEEVEKDNAYAESKNFSNYGELFVLPYESKSFVTDMKNIMTEVHPLYKQLHAFVRRKVSEHYKDIFIAEDGPIPSHLLGDMYAQHWNIFDIVNPYPTKKFPNISDILMKKKMTPLDMFVMAEEFYLSIGLERMTPYFWKNSVIEKNEDIDMVCHGSAFDCFDGKDYRIKMCTTVNFDSLETIYHEMGHIEHYMLYSHLPAIFRDSANPGFHEAVGDTVALSLRTIAYLEEIKFIDENIKDDEELEIMFLMQTALSKVSGLPYAYIIDLYRYGIYNGSIGEENLNEMWWKYRLDYQGVCPPNRRTEEDFDAGAKYHIPYRVEYMRYFVANIITFQIYKALCKEANHTGPLFKCSIYNSKHAGKLFREVLSLGKSKPWQDVMKILTKNETSQIEASAILEYFEPLNNWLKKENKNKIVGWKSNNPMNCPKEEN